MKLTGNTALITGGAGGIGLELARQLLARGNTVIVCARSLEKLNEAKAELPSLVTYRCDITRRDLRQKMLNDLAAEGYGINLLVNNAVSMSNFDLALSGATLTDNIRREIETNLVAPIELTQELLPALKAQSSATIINFNSPQGVVPGARTPILSATKAALHSYSRSLRLHLAQDNVKVINVFPPGVQTPKTADLEFRKMPVTEFVKRLLRQLEKGETEIWVGESKALRVFSRLSERLSFRMLNNRLPIIKGTSG